MSQEERLINGELLRLRREAQGWVVTDMALRACLSAKQVRQLEEGGSSAFYSDSVKITAAKKVGGLLGLSADEVFVSSVTAQLQQDVRSEELPVSDVESQTSSPDIEVETSHVEAPVSAKASTSVVSESPVTEEAKPKTSVWAIAGLFAAALAVAAYMQPKEEAPAETAPPLQVVPSEADAAASAAEASASSASAAASAESVTPAAVQKAASTPATTASAAVPATPSASKAP